MHKVILMMLLGYTPTQDKSEERQQKFPFSEPEMGWTDVRIKGDWKL